MKEKNCRLCLKSQNSAKNEPIFVLCFFWNPYGVVIRMVKESEQYDEKCGNESSFCALHSL
jgi:hypothetical protein